MPVINESRSREIQSIFDWVKTNCQLNNPVSISAEAIEEKTQARVSYVHKVLFVLERKGYITRVQRRGGASQITVIADLSAIKGLDIDTWIRQHQAESDRKTREKKRQSIQVNEPSSPKLNYDQALPDLQKLGPTPVEQNQTVETTTISDQEVTALTSVVAEEELTPAQRLLRNAQQLVEEEQRIKAQQEQDRANAAEKPVQIGLSTEQLAAFESRLKNTEGRIDTILYFFQQASHALRGLDPVGLPTEHEEEVTETVEPSPRNQLILLVNAYAAATEKPQRETWRYLYGQFSVRKGFNPYAYGPATKDRDYLSIIEKHNLFDALFELAKQLFVLPELK